MPSDCLDFKTTQGVAWITLCRPEAMNSLSPTLLSELNKALERIEGDAEIRACIITGKGRAFSAGGDLKALDAFAEEADASVLTARYLSNVTSTLRRIELLRVPTIAAVNGYALAGGLELVLCCDIVVASSAAVFGDGHAKYGLLPGGGGSVRLPRHLGVNRAKYLMLTGEQVSAETMLHWGLVSQVYPAECLLSGAGELARSMAERSSPVALSRMKRMIDDGLEQPLEAALRSEQVAVALHNESEDRNEGLSAFRERRPPVFVGR